MANLKKEAAVCTVIRCSNWHARIMIVYENCWSFFQRFRMRSGMIHELQKMFCLYCSSMFSVFMTICRNIIHEMGAHGPCRILWMATISHVQQTPISPCVWNHGAQFIVRCVHSSDSPYMFHTSPNPACRLLSDYEKKASILDSLKLTAIAMCVASVVHSESFLCPFKKFATHPAPAIFIPLQPLGICIFSVTAYLETDVHTVVDKQWPF